MKKLIATVAVAALVAAVQAGDILSVIPPTALAQGGSTNAVCNTFGYVGNADIVIHAALASGGKVTVDFKSAPTNGTDAAYTYQPTNNCALLKSYVIDKPGVTRITFPAVAPTYGRWLKAVVTSTAGANVVAVEYQAQKQAQ